jgi:hypothetical protein
MGTPLNAEPAAALQASVLSARLPGEVIRQRLREIHEEALARSAHLGASNFSVIHPRDLEILFHAYDEKFFSNALKGALGARRLRFRLSRRMTRAGGRTARVRLRSGEELFEIAIAVDLLFDGFKSGDRPTTVCGALCRSRLEALQRVFEHELVHLIEMLCWGESHCCGARFQDIAWRLFMHEAHTHQLITRQERAADSGIHAGSEVTFEFEGRRLRGRVNRITKRATVLVADREGLLYSDGVRYKAFYVPLRMLEQAEDAAQTPADGGARGDSPENAV